MTDIPLQILRYFRTPTLQSVSVAEASSENPGTTYRAKLDKIDPQEQGR